MRRVALALFVSVVAAVGGGASPSAPAYPPAPRGPVVDHYFGTTVPDPYRWMENDKDPDWLPFLKGQNDHTRAVLNTIPGRDALLRRIQQLSGDTTATRSVQRAGGKLFYEQRPADAELRGHPGLGGQLLALGQPARRDLTADLSNQPLDQAALPDLPKFSDRQSSPSGQAGPRRDDSCAASSTAGSAART